LASVAERAFGFDASKCRFVFSDIGTTAGQLHELITDAPMASVLALRRATDFLFCLNASPGTFELGEISAATGQLKFAVITGFVITRSMARHLFTTSIWDGDEKQKSKKGKFDLHRREPPEKFYGDPNNAFHDSVSISTSLAKREQMVDLLKVCWHVIPTTTSDVSR
jgi:hypothetical protein